MAIARRIDAAQGFGVVLPLLREKSQAETQRARRELETGNWRTENGQLKDSDFGFSGGWSPNGGCKKTPAKPELKFPRPLIPEAPCPSKACAAAAPGLGSRLMADGRSDFAARRAGRGKSGHHKAACRIERAGGRHQSADRRTVSQKINRPAIRRGVRVKRRGKSPPPRA